MSMWINYEKSITRKNFRFDRLISNEEYHKNTNLIFMYIKVLPKTQDENQMPNPFQERMVHDFNQYVGGGAV